MGLVWPRFPSFQILAAAAIAGAVLLGGGRAHARSAGIDSTDFPSLATACNGCHTSGTAISPTVMLTASDLMPMQAEQITLTFTVTTPNGNPGAAGFNIRSSQQGVFAVGGANSASTRVTTGTNGWSEATHSAPKPGEPATFTVLWTPSANTTGSVTFTAWGNGVNDNGNNGGDTASSTTLMVMILCTPVTWYRDVDGDGYGAATSGTNIACAMPAGYVASNTDCNDAAAAVHPGATEVCNAVDDNCAGGADEGLTISTFYRDVDLDGYGAAASGMTSGCAAPSGYVASNTDCNDGAVAVHPGATEVCNGVDDNCAGGADEGVTTTFYRDMDVDTYGAAASGTTSACSAPAGYVANNTDCNDAMMAVHPGATEVCNGVDDNCTGGADEGVTTTFYRDVDIDTYGAAASGTISACSAPAGYVANNTDCNDGAMAVHPGATEVCNGVDDNCAGGADEGVTTTFYRDMDIDGYGATASGTTSACAAPAGYVANNTDCNDGAMAVHPGATEVCNGVDDNCAGGADEGFGTETCGIGACQKTVALCLNGVPQICVPDNTACVDAGSDAASDAGPDGAAGAGGVGGVGGTTGAAGGGASGGAGAGGATGGAGAGGAGTGGATGGAGGTTGSAGRGGTGGAGGVVGGSGGAGGTSGTAGRGGTGGAGGTGGVTGGAGTTGAGGAGGTGFAGMGGAAGATGGGAGGAAGRGGTTGGAGRDGGPTDARVDASDARTDAATAGGGDGCGCAIAPTPATQVLGLALALFTVAARRRRPRSPRS